MSFTPPPTPIGRLFCLSFGEAGTNDGRFEDKRADVFARASHARIVPPLPAFGK